MRKLLPALILLLSFTAQSRANNLIDSLEKRLAIVGDSEKVMTLTRLVSEYQTINPDKAAEYSETAVKLADQLKRPYLQVLALHSQCAVYNTHSNFDGSLASGLMALKISEEIKNNGLIARSLNNIGYTYQKLNDHKTALIYFYKAKTLEKYLDDEKIRGNLYNNFGNSFFQTQELDSAMSYHQRALEIRLRIKDMRGISYSYNNIGNVYIEKKDPERSLEYYIKSMTIKQDIGDRKGLAGGNINIADVYSDIQKWESAVRYAEKGVALAAEIHAKDFLLNGYQSAARAYEGLGDFKKVSEYQKKYIALKDSIYNDNVTKQIAEMQTKYESDKKQKAIELANAQLESNKAQISKQNTMFWGAVIGAVLLLILVGFIYRSYLIKQKANNQLEVANNQLQHLNEIVNGRNKEIERQSNELRTKNKDITDSILYAQRIQSAIMPALDELRTVFPSSFVYYRPRDIVSGDFYWFLKTEDHMVIACADCTGHGVPGAFMSMICVQLLNTVIRDSKVTAPEQALQLLDEGVRSALHQSGSDHDTTDGMDIALCAINLKKNIVEYAGAFRPLYIMRKGELLEIPANKFSIGGHRTIEKNFAGHRIKLEKDDLVYLFTDGYADQFGGAKGKKFKMKQFKTLLSTINDKPIADQLRIIDETMINWKNKFEQIDDILVMGLKI